MNKNKRTRSNLDIVYTILDFARLILITVVAAMVILVFVARKEEVRGTSMYPTLVEGESVIINMAANYVGEIKRFDVVVAREYRSDDLWVKRVIGLPGETISYREDVLYVDGKAMEEPFLDKKYVEQVKKVRISFISHRIIYQKSWGRMNICWLVITVMNLWIQEMML